MPEIDGVRYCDRCGAEIVLAPVIRGKMTYCCEDCAAGKACDCALILDDEHREDRGGAY
jgi:hypothetical protein